MDNNDSEQPDRAQEAGHQRLSPDGQKILSILESKLNSEFHPFVNGKINEALSSITGEFLAKVKASIQVLIFEDNEVEGGEDQQRRLMTTIVDKDWQREEKQIRYCNTVLSRCVIRNKDMDFILYYGWLILTTTRISCTT
jgi:hypothetical protein